MGYKRYKMLQKYINGEPQEEYKQGELIDDTIYQTLDACNEGNQNPDKPIEGYIYQWVTVSGEYVCNDVNKYTKEKEQKSSDNGVTWTDTGRTRQGDLIEVNSADCGYVPPTPGGYENQYLTFEAIEDGTFTFTGTTSSSKLLSYSVDDGQTWTAFNGTESPTITTGNKIMWKAEITKTSSVSLGFSSTGRYNVEGNPMSLLFGDNFKGQTDLTGKNYALCGLFKDSNVINAKNLSLPATTLTEGCYSFMFANCTSLVNAPALPATTLAIECYELMFYGCSSLTTAPALPATTLAIDCYNQMFNGCTSLTTAPVLPATTLAGSCYELMFYGCKSLTTAPVLPATTLVDNCYGYMFWGCRSLVNAPALPATTLAIECYHRMFENCSSLTTAPELPATTLAKSCYNHMFDGCTSLNYIKCLATDISARDCTRNWLSYVASTGTFIKAASMSNWTNGISGIPEGWTVQDA